MPTAWDQFWFKSIDTRQYAALRIAFGGLSAIYFVNFFPFVETQFSSSGWLTNTGQIAQQNGGSWSLFFIPKDFDGSYLAYAILSLGTLSAILFMLGWKSRIAACVTWIVWVSLWNRNPLLLDGDDAVLKVMCFYLMLSPCGNSWSIDACYQSIPQLAPVWPLRLIQFQIALIYFVSGWVKFYSQEWQDGTVLPYVLIHPQYSLWQGVLNVNNKIFSVFLTWLADFIRWWELLFPFLLLNYSLRKLCIMIGILFHIGLLLTMNLRWFPLIMLSLYPALLANSGFLSVEQTMLKLYRAYTASSK
jgi:Vitamin K-dependent gamma-carboxylase